MKHKKPRLAEAIVTVREDQLEWLKKNRYDLSSLTQAYLDEFIRSIEKTKKGIVVPAWIKVASKETIRERARKNPRLKRFLKD